MSYAEVEKESCDKNILSKIVITNLSENDKGNSFFFFSLENDE